MLIQVYWSHCIDKVALIRNMCGMLCGSVYTRKGEEVKKLSVPAAEREPIFICNESTNISGVVCSS